MREWLVLTLRRNSAELTANAAFHKGSQLSLLATQEPLGTIRLMDISAAEVDLLLLLKKRNQILATQVLSFLAVF